MFSGSINAQICFAKWICFDEFVVVGCSHVTSCRKCSAIFFEHIQQQGPLDKSVEITQLSSLSLSALGRHSMFVFSAFALWAFVVVLHNYNLMFLLLMSINWPKWKRRRRRIASVFYDCADRKKTKEKACKNKKNPSKQTITVERG